MKPLSVSFALILASTWILHAQKGGELLLRPNTPPSPPPPVSVLPVTPLAPAASAASASSPSPVFVYDQKAMGGRAPLVTPEQAQTVIAKFKEAYVKAGSPRILIYVNRELVDETSGLKLSAHSERVETSRATGRASTAEAPAASETQKATHKNTYRNRDRKETPLADRQTLRDVERLFGRPLRMGGAAIVDQPVATQMAAGSFLDSLTTRSDSTEARREREAISKIADVVLEVLVSSRNATVTRISGDAVVSVPDIQATAIRLNDSKILGQATAADLLNRAGNAGRFYDVREITEATALSLMEDMTL